MKIAALLVSGLLLAATPAIAKKPALKIATTFVHVEIFNPTVTPLAQCQGEDAVYTVLHVTGEGAAQSTDPRLSGTFIADAVLLDNPNTGYGASYDNWQIVDSTTRALKAKGTAWAVDRNPNQIKSLVMAELVDETKLLAHATVTLPNGPGVPLVIEYGGTGALDTQDRALLISGDCNKALKKFGFR